MNDLYLIGNGFDLAHGLKTSYNDFLLWYLNEYLKKFLYDENYEDDLMKIERKGNRYRFPGDFKSLPNVIGWLEICNYKWKGKHDFFEKIIKNYSNNRWVDIEYEYYVALIDTFKGSERNNVLRSDFYINLVKPLNSCFNSILIKLLEYLHTIEITPEKSNRHIEGILMENTGARRNYSGEKLFVNFNYTTTMELYSDHFLPNNLIYIHGRLNNQSSPIIFGYGDEMDPHYEKLENLNSNDFLQNIKSFNYLKTGNYQKVIRFLENEFTVKVLGHSCGLSDRILLNTIFEHPKCRAIKIFYYQKSEKENDFFEKTQEISRHFRASMKGEMRKRIVSFDQCEPLLPLSKQN